jgi:hypothetical protein
LLLVAICCISFSGIQNIAFGQLAQYIIGGPGNELATRVVYNPQDKSSIIAGYSYDYSGGVASNCQALLIKVDKNYHIIWQKSFGIPAKNNLIQDMIITLDGNIVVVGKVGGTSTDIFADNTAAILKFSSSDGSLMWQKCFRATPLTIGGELFFGVTELTDGTGRLVAVGAYNFTGAGAGSMICVFQPNGTLLYNQVFDTPSGDDYQGVTTSANGNSVYICGEFVGNFKDGRVLKYTPGTTTGAVNWAKGYDFSLTGGLQSNFFKRITLSGSKLMISGSCLKYYSTTSASSQFIAKINDDGSNAQVFQVTNGAALFANSPAIAVEGDDHIFTVQSPAAAYYDPTLWTTGLSTSTVVTDITSLASHLSKTPIRFKMPTKGLQSINDMRLNEGLLRMVGSTVDQDGVNGNDIYYLISSTSLTNLNNTCDTAHETVSIINPVVYSASGTSSSLSFNPIYVTVDTASSNYTIAQICGDVVNSINSNPTIENKSLRVFPNPSNNHIIIESARPICTVTITNALGQIVYEKHGQRKQWMVDVKTLPVGLYYIQADGEVKMFIKH